MISKTHGYLPWVFISHENTIIAGMYGGVYLPGAACGHVEGGIGYGLLKKKSKYGFKRSEIIV